MTGGSLSFSMFAALTLLWQLAEASPFSRVRRDNCYKPDEQIAFQDAQRACIEEAGEAQSKTLGKKDPEQPTADFGELLTYYSKPKTADAPPRVVSLKIKTDFDACFKEKAAKNLNLEKTPKEFEKKYTKAGLVPLLEKVNDLKCKATAAKDILDEGYIKSIGEKWARLSMFQRAFQGALTKIVGLLNPDYVKCFAKVSGLTLPQLLCVNVYRMNWKVYGEFADCVQRSFTPEAKTLFGLKKAATSASEPDGTKGKEAKPVSKRVIDFLCAQQTAKVSPRGAAKILLSWPIGVILGVISIPVGAVFLMWKCACDTCEDPKSDECCGYMGLVGLVCGALYGLCLLLYCVFGLPWKMLAQLLGTHADADHYSPVQAVDEVALILGVPKEVVDEVKSSFKH